MTENNIPRFFTATRDFPFPSAVGATVSPGAGIVGVLMLVHGGGGGRGAGLVGFGFAE